MQGYHIDDVQLQASVCRVRSIDLQPHDLGYHIITI
jgi:hypothetical protein